MRGADVGMDHVIHNISEFLGVLNRYKNEFSTTSHNDNFMFRGMSTASWKLLPGIFREYSKPETTSDVVSQKQYRKMYRSNESEILAHFRKEASGFLTNISQNDDFTWLQYAQHYGVPTRLLDFTANPLVALYFSCQSESKDDSVVWIININNFQRWSHDEDICKSTNTREIVIDRIMCEMRGDFIHMENSKRPPLKERPLFFLPPYIDQRMSAQASRFMLWGTNQFALEDTPKLFEFVDSFRNNDGIWSFGFEMAQDIIGTLRNKLSYLFYDNLEFRQKTISRKFSKKILGLDGICFQTVLLRPVAWEHKLFGQVLASGLNELSDKRHDFNYSFTLTSVKRLQTFNELFDYITSKSEQLLRSISYISMRIYETIPDAFGAPGVDGDPDYIIYAANKLVEIYSSIIDWSLDFNTIITEEDFRGLAKSFSKMCDVTLSDIERFSSEFSEMTNKIPDNISDENLTMEFNITLSLSEPNTGDFYCEIKKLQQKFGI